MIKILLLFSSLLVNMPMAGAAPQETKDPLPDAVIPRSLEALKS